MELIDKGKLVISDCDGDEAAREILAKIAKCDPKESIADMTQKIIFGESSMPVIETPSLFWTHNADRIISDVGHYERMKLCCRNFNYRMMEEYHVMDMRMYHTQIYYNKNYAIAKDRKKVLAKIELPEGMEAAQNKFGAFCRIATAIYMNESVRRESNRNVFPVSNYTIGQTTYVRFSDGTEESCTPKGIDLGSFERFGNYFGQDICFAKKIFGSTGKALHEMEVTDILEVRRKRKEEKEKYHREQIERDKKYKEEEKEKYFKIRVERRVEEILIERAALERIERIDAAEERRKNSQE